MLYFDMEEIEGKREETGMAPRSTAVLLVKSHQGFTKNKPLVPGGN